MLINDPKVAYSKADYKDNYLTKDDTFRKGDKTIYKKVYSIFSMSAFSGKISKVSLICPPIDL